jgi:6-phosphogluconolactonase
MNVEKQNLHALVFDPDLVAEVILDELRRAVEERGRAVIAIPGGRSPGPVLTALAGRLPEEVRSRLHLFWVDERSVPPGDKERNSSATLAAWKQGGPLPAYVYPMPAEYQDLEAAAREYAGTLDEVAEGRSLDLCLLGIGEDGHIASLFPNHPGLLRDEPVFAVYDSPKPPLRRLTLSLPIISSAGLRIVLASGREKGLVLNRAAKGPDPSLPVSLLPSKNTIWFVDDPVSIT